MNPTAQAAKAEFENTRDRLLRTFDATPDDRLNWRPSDTARTPIEIVAHCANSVHWLAGSFAGEPMPKLSPAEFDAIHMANDKKFTSKEQVVAHLEAESQGFVGWLDAVSDEKLAENWESPFGAVPLAMAITFPAKHTDGHISQLEYLQTIYGDRVWH